MDESKTVFFKCEFTYTQENLKKYQRLSIFLDKFEIILHTLYLTLLLFVALVITDSEYRFYSILFLTTFIILRRVILCGNTTYNRIISQNEGVPLHQTYEFNNYHILVVHPRSGNQHKFHYAQIRSIAQTELFYILYLQHRQYMLLEKEKLTSEAGDDFIRFLCGACPNIKPKKLRNATWGKVIYYALIVLLCLVILENELRYFFIF